MLKVVDQFFNLSNIWVYEAKIPLSWDKHSIWKVEVYVSSFAFQQNNLHELNGDVKAGSWAKLGLGKQGYGIL